MAAITGRRNGVDFVAVRLLMLTARLMSFLAGNVQRYNRTADAFSVISQLCDSCHSVVVKTIEFCVCPKSLLMNYSMMSSFTLPRTPSRLTLRVI